MSWTCSAWQPDPRLDAVDGQHGKAHARFVHAVITEAHAYHAHQHTSKGSVPGITGDVDLNVTTRNYPKIIKTKGLTRLREVT